MDALKDSIDELLDKLNDDVFFERLYDRYTERYQAIPDPVTPELDTRMARRFASISEPSHNIFLRHKCFKIVAACAVLMTIAGYGIVYADAWRVQINNLWMSFYQGSNNRPTDADFQLIEQIPPGFPIPAYIPDGYTLSEVDAGEVKIRLVYQNAASHTLVYEVFAADSTIFSQSSTQQGSISSAVSGHPGYIIPFGDINTIVWRTEQNIFRLSGSSPQKTLLKVAESTK